MGKLRIFIASAITVVWSAVYTAAIFMNGFTAPPEVSGIMLGVVTWLFGKEIADKIRDKQ